MLRFHSNTHIQGLGSALYARKHSNVHLIHPNFIGNDESVSGGVLFLENTNAYVQKGLFSNNSGRVLYVKETDYGVAFYDNVFVGNRGPVFVDCSGKFG